MLNDNPINNNESNDEENSLNITNNKEELEFPVLITILTEIFGKKDEGKKCICHNYIEGTKDNINDIFEEKELISSVKIRIIKNENDKNNNSFKIRLYDLCNSLKILGYPMGGSMINIYLNEASDYVFYGPEPIDHNICINSSELGKGNLIKIKIINYLDKKMLNVNNKTDEIKELDENDEESELNESNKGNGSENTVQNFFESEARRRERRIGFIVEKVNAWRRLYNGFYNENGEHTRYSLDTAAELLGISKKSLDDYLLQIRLGRKFGFDFNKYRNERVGNLREFVKKHRNKDNNQINNKDNKK